MKYLRKVNIKNCTVDENSLFLASREPQLIYKYGTWNMQTPKKNKSV